MFRNDFFNAFCIKRKYAGILAAVFISVSSAIGWQMDTLKIEQVFQSPIPNPRAIEFSREMLWVCNMQSRTLYVLDSTMKIADSVQTDFHRITGITFRNDELWICVDSAVGDSEGYCQYAIYQIDKHTGSTRSSITFTASSISSDTNIIWGMTYHEGRFLVSHNGGWGPCIYVIDPDLAARTGNLCCAHPCGMSVIGDTIWSIRSNSANGDGNHVSALGINAMSDNSQFYHFQYYATDLTSDGSNMWICDRIGSRILKVDWINRPASRYPTSAIRPSMVKGRNLTRLLDGNLFIPNLPSNNTLAKVSVFDIHGKRIPVDILLTKAGCIIYTNRLSSQTCVLHIESSGFKYSSPFNAVK